MKRVLALILILSLAATLTGCLSPDEREARKEALNVLNGSSDGAYALPTGTTLENQTLFDDQDIIIQLAGIQGTPTDPELVLAVKNGSRHDIGFTVDSLTINGWQVDGWSDLYDVSSHSLTMGTIVCGSDLSLCDVSDIASIGLNFSIYDEESYDDIAAVSCELATSASGAVLSYIPDGAVLLDESDILVKAVNLLSSASGTTLSLYVENNSRRDIIVETSHARLNDLPLELWFWDTTTAGARRLMTEWLYEEDTYDDLYLGPEDEITFQLEIYDEETGTLLISQQVTLTPEDI